MPPNNAPAAPAASAPQAQAMNSVTPDNLFAVIGELEFSKRALLNEIRQRDQVIAEQRAKIEELQAAVMSNQGGKPS